jgi:hypothetical protein
MEILMIYGLDGNKMNLVDRDIKILSAIYQLQAVRAIDIADAYYTGKNYGMARMQRLVERGYLERSYTVTPQGRRNHAVLQISEKGVDALVSVGVVKEQERRRARDLKLSGWDMVQRVDVSRICIHLAKAGWSFMSAQEAKQKYNINHTSIMHCCLISPDNEIYQTYRMGVTIKENVLAKLVSELGENRHSSLILYDAKEPLEKTEAYQSLLSELQRQQVFVNELCLIPLVDYFAGLGSFSLGVTMLKNSTANHIWNYFWRNYGFVSHMSNRYGFGTMYTKINDKDYIICNYLRRNLTALKMLARTLTISEHRNSGYNAFVLTWQGFKDEVQEEIDRVQPGRDFIQILPVLSKDMTLPDDKPDLKLIKPEKPEGEWEKDEEEWEKDEV